MKIHYDVTPADLVAVTEYGLRNNPPGIVLKNVSKGAASATSPSHSSAF